jgi:hypothetical protein
MGGSNATQLVAGDIRPDPNRPALGSAVSGSFNHLRRPTATYFFAHTAGLALRTHFVTTAFS